MKSKVDYQGITNHKSAFLDFFKWSLNSSFASSVLAGSQRPSSSKIIFEVLINQQTRPESAKSTITP
ncbi:MAG: hypothetical protein KBT40_00830 [bacterium]|nr:hypothetical protein [Candidatus Minthenecus merdequi]